MIYIKELLLSLDWNTLITTLWTVVLLPILTYIGAEIKKTTEALKIDKYTEILQKNVSEAVKDVYQTIVCDIKNTDEWTEEKQKEVKEICKQKVLSALSNSVYSCLKKSNQDFEEYLDILIESKVYDVKKANDGEKI